MKPKPKFMISKSKVFETVDKLKKVVDEVTYSWKTNPKIGEILNETETTWQSVHSLNELNQVKNKSKIWFFLFATNNDELNKLKKLKINNFVVDNLEDLNTLKTYIKTNNLKINLLLRMKLRENTLQTGKHYVFGMKTEIVKKKIDELKKIKEIEKLGVHVHRKTQNVSEWNLIDEVANVISEEYLTKIDIINLGGGLPAKYKNINDKLIENILNKIKEFKKYISKYNIKVFIEPGRFIAAPAIKLKTNILAIHDNTIFLNASIFNGALDTVIANIKLLVENELEAGNVRYTLKGSTPDSSDILRYSVYLENPKVGDEIIFTNCGAYTYSTNFCALEEIGYEIID